MGTLIRWAIGVPGLIAGLTTSTLLAAEPDWGPSIIVIDAASTGVQDKLDAVFKSQEHSQFGPGRFAYLIKPGTYNLDIKVGYGVEVIGVGESPEDVQIRGAVRSNPALANGNATCNFWRAMSNLSILPADGKPNTWAVSQGTSMRRVHVKGDLDLWDKGWSSGGFTADCKVDGTINSGSQQQWLARNSAWQTWTGGGWNMVFVGSGRIPEGDWPAKPYTSVSAAPVVREKPYLYVDGQGEWFVRLPALRRDAAGLTWTDGTTPGQSLPLSNFHLAHPDRDTAATLNAALAAGKHLLFTPGEYPLTEPLHISRPNTIVLGLGFPTLTPTTGQPAITTADVDGITLAGLLLEAGPTPSPELLRIGEVSTVTTSHADNPTALFDIYCRAGGFAPGKAKRFVTVNSNDVIGDNLWLWRADHGAGAAWGQNDVENGIVVAGRDVTMYGLFVEHCQGFQTLWTGESGRCYFYQSELPYDPPSQDAWQHEERTGSVKGFASYKVADTVEHHQAFGLGVYCVFTKAAILSENGIESPETPGISLHHMITLRFNGKKDSGILHVVNGRGDPVVHKQSSRVLDLR